jgi:hypothetical protein
MYRLFLLLSHSLTSFEKLLKAIFYLISKHLKGKVVREKRINRKFNTVIKDVIIYYI